MRAPLCLISLLGLTTRLSPAAAAQEIPLSAVEIAARAQPAVALIVGLDAHGTQVSQGSGFFIDARGRLITNRHVVEGAADLQVHLHDGTVKADVHVLSDAMAADLVLLSVNTRVERYLRLGEVEALHIGERLYVVGNPLGLAGTFTDGILSGRRQIGGIDYLQITAPIAPGSSGGPVLNDRGHVVGVATLTVRGGQNLNLAVSALHATALLRAASGSTPFRASALSAYNRSTLDGFHGIPWGASGAEVEASLGTPEEIENVSGLEVRTYSGEVLGSHASILVVLDPVEGLRMGSYVIPVGTDRCQTEFARVRDAIGVIFPAFRPIESLESRVAGDLCRQIRLGTASWSTSWQLRDGRISMLLLPNRDGLVLQVIYRQEGG